MSCGLGSCRRPVVCVVCGCEVEGSREYIQGELNRDRNVALDQEWADRYAHSVCLEEHLVQANTLAYYRSRYSRVKARFTEKVYRITVEGYGGEVEPLMKRLEAVMRLYRWLSIDMLRGYYTPAGNRAGGYVRVVEGWNDILRKSVYVERLERLVADPPYPIVLVVPFNTNLCVRYYDLWVEERHALDAAKRIVPKGEAFSFSDGYYVRALYKEAVRHG